MSDEALVELVRVHDDREAYRLLVERHYPACLRYATRFLGNSADAEEAVQDAFVRAHRFRASCDTGRPFARWLFTILVNQCRTMALQRERSDRGLVSIDGVQHPSRDGADQDLAPAVHDALQSLPAEVREALMLKYVEGWSYEEIAALSGVGVSALKMRVKRGRERLESVLARHGGGRDA